ncbi:MAG: hypothetical protein ACR2P5_01935 [Gammaproteobacteria bacterium]
MPPTANRRARGGAAAAMRALVLYFAVWAFAAASAQETPPEQPGQSEYRELADKVDEARREFHTQDLLGLRRIESVEAQMNLQNRNINRILLIAGLSAALALALVAGRQRAQNRLANERVNRAVREAEVLIGDIRREIARPEMEFLRAGHFLRRMMRRFFDDRTAPEDILRARAFGQDAHLPASLHYMAQALIAGYEKRWEDAAGFLEQLRFLEPEDPFVLLHLSNAHEQIAAETTDKQAKKRRRQISGQYYAQYAEIVRIKNTLDAEPPEVLPSPQKRQSFAAPAPLPAPSAPKVAPPVSQIQPPAVSRPAVSQPLAEKTPPQISAAEKILPPVSEIKPPAVSQPLAEKTPPEISATEKTAPPVSEIKSPAVSQSPAVKVSPEISAKAKTSPPVSEIKPPAVSQPPAEKTPPEISAEAKTSPPVSEIKPPAVSQSPAAKASPQISAEAKTLPPVSEIKPPASATAQAAGRASDSSGTNSSGANANAAHKTPRRAPVNNNAAASVSSFQKTFSAARGAGNIIKRGCLDAWQEVQNAALKITGGETAASLPLLPTPIISDIPEQTESAAESEMWKQIRKGDLCMEQAANVFNLRRRHRIIDRALVHYAQAQGHKTNRTLYLNWGLALLGKALHLPPKKRDPSFNAAIDKFLAGNVIAPHKFDFALASLYAIIGRAGECRRWLETSRESGMLDRESLRNAADFENVRRQPWFAEFAR